MKRKQRYKKFKPHSNPLETRAWRNRQTNESKRRAARA